MFKSIEWSIWNFAQKQKTVDFTFAIAFKLCWSYSPQLNIFRIYIFPFSFLFAFEVFYPCVFELIDWTVSCAFYVLLQAKLRQSDWKTHFRPSASRPIDYAFLQEGRSLKLSKCRWKEIHLKCIHFSQNIVAKSTGSKCSRHAPTPLKSSSSLSCVR